MGFKHAQITDAMKNTIGLGGDLNDALDWLCLNSNNGKEPKKVFSCLVILVCK